MPKLVWTPPEGEKRTYDFELEDLMWAEVRAIQKVTGADGLMGIGEMLEKADGSVIPALLWVLRKRQEPTLTFADLDTLKIREVSMETDEEQEEEDPKEGAPEPPPAAAEEEGQPPLSLAT